MSVIHDELASLRAELAQVRRQNEDLVVSNNAYLKRARDAEAAAKAMVWPPLPLWGTAVRKQGSGYTGPGIVRGYVVASDGSFRIVIGHRIEGGEGEFFHVYMPKQVEIDHAAPERAPLAEVPSAPRRFRHRKRGSTYELLGEAELDRAIFSSKEGAKLYVYRREEDGVLIAVVIGMPMPMVCRALLIGVAEVQTANPLRGGSKLTIYRCESDGRLWARPTMEFEDGRFEEIANG